jgi:2-dehydro-3-deoxygluconokinase
MTRAPVYCLGETMAMVASRSGDALATSDLFTITPGGAETNVAGHLAALGQAVSWLGRLGTDPLGDRVIAAVEAAGVDTLQVVRDPSARTGVYFKDRIPGESSRVYYYRLLSAASRMSTDDLARWKIPRGAWVHTSGITPALSTSCDELVQSVLDRANAAGYTVSFDVNHRAALWANGSGGPRLRDLAARATVVFVGLDEAETLWGTATAEAVAEFLPSVPHLVVKDSDREAVEFVRGEDGETTVHREPARFVDVVEPVGAGDAFAAGYLAAYLSGADSAERLRQGHELAAWTLGSHHDFRPGFSRGVAHEHTN